MNWFNKLQMRRILTIFLAGVFLMISTACSGTSAQGMNPKSTPVQAGGANNPYKNGGDKYTNSNSPTSTESRKQKGDQASLPLNSQTLLVANKDSELLYPGAETPLGRIKKEAELPIITEEEFKHTEPGGLIQGQPDLGNRIQDRIETVTESFEKASGFLKEKADEASARPELQKNPSVGK
ncbi:hypothetical protein F2Y95_16695 [Aphanizomenon flos-aquae CCAP 1446/1C]|nr:MULTISPECIES: DUF6658 family protein [Anabaena]MBY5283337.1 hypothetical protein [Anabaena sp. CCAP 1446/1C]MBY5311549.1 hypothetical protein [Anabaena sp. CCAP 1446/1C]MCM2406396.1 hypothetical protein [Anabaena sp. CCAP 1446/1C]